MVVPISTAPEDGRAERAGSAGVAGAMGGTASGMGGMEGGKARVDAMLDLQPVPTPERWSRIQTMMRRLEGEHAGQWRIKLLLNDAPEEGHALPRLLELLTEAGLLHDATREPGGLQSIVVWPAPPVLAAV